MSGAEINGRVLDKGLLRCPVCGTRLARDGGSLVCNGGRRHSFDIASAGYVNLAGPRQAGGGDSRELAAARAAFLASGHYDIFADAVCGMLGEYVPAGGFIVDAGCGEGFYSLRAASSTGAALCGFDLSKHAVTYAAKAAGREGADALFCVGGIFDMPLFDGCADAVMNLFAPCAAQEFSRVLKADGCLIVAGAGEHHLEGLKRVLYNEVRLNQPRADLPDRMTPIKTEKVSYDITIESNEQIMSLFSMTPYFYRTDSEGRARLGTLETLTTTVDFDIFVYRRGDSI